MYCARWGDADTAQVLLDAGAEAINLCGFDGRNAHELAIEWGHADVVALIERQQQVSDGKQAQRSSGTEPEGATKPDLLLLRSSRAGDVLGVLDALRRGATINGSSADIATRGWTALIAATSSGKADVVSVLLDAGADVQVVDRHGWTAIMYACRWGHVGIVALLLSNGSGATLDEELISVNFLQPGSLGLSFSSGDPHRPMITAVVRGSLADDIPELRTGMYLREVHGHGAVPLEEEVGHGIVGMAVPGIRYSIVCTSIVRYSIV